MPPIYSGIPAADTLRRDRDLQQHLVSLGLSTAPEYEAWCERHGFSVRLKKNWKERCRERYAADQEKIRQLAAQCRFAKRRPQQTLERVLDGDLGSWEESQSHWQLIHMLSQGVRREPSHAAFRQLLMHVESSTSLLNSRPALSQFGQQEGNTYIHALLGLARHASQWIRPLAVWTPRTHNVRRQFASLAAHLLSKYPVPSFLNSAWFVGDVAHADKQQSWYRAIGNGASPRDLDLPLRLTRRMAHYFLKAPSRLSVESALRYGQVMGLGGNPRLVDVLLGSRIAADFSNNDFWSSVIEWLIEHPAIEMRNVGPLIDFIRYRRFGESQDDADDDEVEPAMKQGTTETTFEIRGRTVTTLLRQMHEWHGGYRTTPGAPHLVWLPSGIEPLVWNETVDLAGSQRQWTTVELLSKQDLLEEGSTMRHCVVSYTSLCVHGGTSIWSLGVACNGGTRKRRLTIEISTNSRVIQQIRGKTNRLPTEREMEIIRRWAAEAGLTIPSHLRSRC